MPLVKILKGVSPALVLRVMKATAEPVSKQRKVLVSSFILGYTANQHSSRCFLSNCARRT